jgi:hypothetical protein
MLFLLNFQNVSKPVSNQMGTKGFDKETLTLPLGLSKFFWFLSLPSCN